MPDHDSSSDPVTQVALDGAIGRLELQIERRIGAIESDVREIQVTMVNRVGPVVDEMRQFEIRVAEVESEIALAKQKGGLLTRPEVMELARSIFNENVSGGRTSSDYYMRIVMFAVSVGTLIFVTKGGV